MTDAPKPRIIHINAEPADALALAETLRAAGYVVHVNPPIAGSALADVSGASLTDICDAEQLRQDNRLN